MRKKFLFKLIIISVVLVSGGFLIYRMFSPNNSDPRFRTVKVGHGEISQVVTATGTTNPMITVVMITHEPDIASFARRKIHFKDGTVVEDRKNLSPVFASMEK